MTLSCDVPANSAATAAPWLLAGPLDFVPSHCRGRFDEGLAVRLGRVSERLAFIRSGRGIRRVPHRFDLGANGAPLLRVSF